MKTSRSKLIALFSVILALCLTGLSKTFAQAKYHGQIQDMVINGTSNIHDWDMKSSKGVVDATISIANDKVTFSSLSFSVPAESFKSGHSGMDNNTYKALKTKANPSISFVLLSGNVTSTGNNTYQLKGVGKLTIAGTTVQTDLVTTLKYNPSDKSFSCTGTKKFKMTQYGVKPPTALLGTIKTGDEVIISYNLNIKG